MLLSLNIIQTSRSFEIHGRRSGYLFRRIRQSQGPSYDIISITTRKSRNIYCLPFLNWICSSCNLYTWRLHKNSHWLNKVLNRKIRRLTSLHRMIITFCTIGKYCLLNREKISCFPFFNQIRRSFRDILFFHCSLFF